LETAATGLLHTYVGLELLTEMIIPPERRVSMPSTPCGGHDDGGGGGGGGGGGSSGGAGGGGNSGGGAVNTSVLNSEKVKRAYVWGYLLRKSIRICKS
jgi:hypothetical protein